MSVSNSRNSAGSSRRVKFDSFSRRRPRRRVSRPTRARARSARATDECRPVPDDQRAAVRGSKLPRRGAGHHDAGAASAGPPGQDGEQKYLRATWAPRSQSFSKRNLEFDFSPDSQSKGTPCRYCAAWSSAPASLLTHTGQVQEGLWRRPTNDTARSTEPGYLIRNWYSPQPPAQAAGEEPANVKECRYCHSAVPWHALSQHEDECRSIMYGTTPTSGYY
uniref:Zinc finger protein n=1 Tax=Macrostomum lignano TaxID=282301 RepID=A0A1I8FEQ8_9PLAT